MKKISLLKPDIRKGILRNEQSEKYTFLSIPDSVKLNDLKQDIKLGAVQFKEVCKEVEKETSSKYIVITTDNLEMGYMAVTYLAACHNEKKERTSEQYALNDEDAGIEEWFENAFQIPVIEENEIYSIHNNPIFNPYEMGGMFGQANCYTQQRKPYWLDCKMSPICVVVKEQHYFGCCDNLDSFDIFKTNERVYILIHKEEEYPYWSDFDDIDDCEEEENCYDDGSSQKEKYLILNYASDEVNVKLQKENKVLYYTQILKGLFKKNDIKTKKGFAYKNIIDMIVAMNDESKCELMEKIVNYAIKDMNLQEMKLLETKDFDFINRFVKVRTRKNKELSSQKMQEELVGMDYVKEQISDIVNVMKYNKIRRNMNIGGSEYHNVHAMLGAPGTAKTTMAKLMGEMMMEQGLLRDNRFICVNGAELKGMYVGHSAPKTKAIFNDHDIIVIDEAYSLVDGKGETDSFSNEAIAQLIIELEEHSMDKLVIFTGYGGKGVTEKNNKMRKFFDANPGIKSRITSTIYFDSYSPEEMVKIFYNMAKVKHFILDEGAKDMVYEHFCKRVKDTNFGNGREGRSLLETSVLFAAKRLLKNENEKYTKKQMQTLTRDDVMNAIKRIECSQKEAAVEMRKKIGFGMMQG